MMNSLASGANLDQVLRELHGKRNWLDGVIRGLEDSLDSPHQKLLEIAKESLSDPKDKRPRVDLGVGLQDEMAELAALVVKPRPGRPRGRRITSA